MKLPFLQKMFPITLTQELSSMGTWLAPRLTFTENLTSNWSINIRSNLMIKCQNCSTSDLLMDISRVSGIHFQAYIINR